MPTDLLRAGSVCGLGSNIHGVHIISLAARSRTAACSGTLADGLAKIRAARESDHVALQKLTSAREARFLKTSMAFSTIEAREYVCQIDRTGNINASPARNLQKAATILLSRNLQKRDFSEPISVRASRVLGPSADITWHRSYPLFATLLALPGKGWRLGSSVFCATACAQ